MRLLTRLAVVLVVAAGTLPASAQSASATDPRAQQPAIGPVPAPLRRLVSLSMRDVPLLNAIQEIDRQADLRLGYTDRLLAGRRVTVQLRDVPAVEALERVLAGTGITVQVSPRGHVTLARARASADTAPPPPLLGAILGLLTDSVSGLPVPDVPVTALGETPEELRGTSVTVRSTDQGYYYFPELPAGVYLVTARRVGYRQAVRRVAVIDGQQTRADIAFGLGLTQLTRVVTTATGPQRRLERGNDVTVLDADSITRTQLVRSVSDLIATRVPGLVALPTSGAPGDPMRLRLRGLHSVLQSDDPLIIVDGARVYGDASSQRAANLAPIRSVIGTAPAAPSPLDKIDPNSIESIEVLKGPSAAALYGSDAANGVIVIRTKRGRPGPARWTTSLDYGRTDQPGDYPDGYFRWGHPLGLDGPPEHCSLRDQTCVLDSVVRFQLLNDPRYSVLGTGDRMAGSVGVSGGTAVLTYNLTGSFADEIGLLRLPGSEADAFQSRLGLPAPSWMRRPHHYRTWSATSGVMATPGTRLSFGLTVSLTRGEQQRSTLETQLSQLMRTYVDSASGSMWVSDGPHFSQPGSLFSEYYRKITDVSTSFRNSANAHWRPLDWLTMTANAGIDFTQRDDRALVPRGMSPTLDSVGVIRVAQGSSLVRSVNVQTTATSRTVRGFRLETSVGANYSSTALADVALGGKGLAHGTTSVNGAAILDPPTETQSVVTTVGWYIEPKISHRRFWFSPGLRFDGGSTFGSRVRLPTFPQLSLSYLVSDETWFPLKQYVGTLRLRAAYGQAGVQPGIGDRLRLYTQRMVLVDSQLVPGTVIRTLGNTTIRPERSTELEGGVDVEFLDQRLTVQFSGYSNTRRDALIPVPVPPSVYGSEIVSVLRNVGVIRNTGLEASVATELLRSNLVAFGTSVAVSRNRNRVVSLAPGVVPFFNSTGDGRVVAGYPLFGRWAKPIIGYRDIDGNGLITASEVQVGDTLVFMGESTPNYTARLSSYGSFLRGQLRVTVDIGYENGLTQINETARLGRVLSRALNDPAAPFAEQAAVAVMHRTNYGLMQTVSTLRFNGLSVAYSAPRRLARLFRAEALGIALQGSNLGLHTNYRGKDPNVNAYSSGNGVADTGILPLPRTWQVRVSTSH